jgi:hypothetical protein
MERYSRTELIAQVAGLASQANKLLAMLMADIGADGEQILEPIPAPVVTIKARQWVRAWARQGVR